MKYVCSDTAILRALPIQVSKKLGVLYKGAIVFEVGENEKWTNVEYKGLSGWVYSFLLDDYVEESGFVVRIPEELKTKDRHDPEQYLVIDGKKKTNLCGEFCVASLTNDDILTFLDKWKLSRPHDYKIGVTENKPLGIDVVSGMAEMYNLKYERFQVPLSDKTVGLVLSAGKIKKLLENKRAIVGVKIGNDGRLNTGSIAHWVVLVGIEPLRNGDGIVKIYNPFTNRMQKYSYAELLKSMLSFGSVTGLWIDVANP